MPICKEPIDKFIAIAEQENVVLGKNKIFPLVEPLKYEEKSIPSSELIEIKPLKFDEQKEYSNYLKEKEKLKNYYLPFLRELYEKVESPTSVEEFKDFDFRRETEEDKKDFSNISLHKGLWEKVTLPHFVGPQGVYNTVYYKDFKLNKIDANKTYLLRFEACDYIADIYINNRLITSHEGFFIPFYIDLSPYIKKGSNTLIIVLHNFATTSGIWNNGNLMYGRKIYAETHFGYDEPNKGWHHCPAGIGIYGKVTFEIKNKVHIDDVYIRPDIDSKSVSGKIFIKHDSFDYTKGTFVEMRIEGRNFKSKILKQTKTYSDLQFGENFIDFKCDIPNMKLWTNKEPFLYEITLKLFDSNGNLLDVFQNHFGMRKFFMDEKSKPRKGVYYFNNERIILNGTNEMGHLELDVIRNDDNQLIDDILIAKVANMNMYRLTQRPVLKKVYDYFDMLGMFAQTDFPLFSYLTYEALPESYKQVSSMEKLIRNHPSCIIVSLMNECMDPVEHGLSQYVIGRNEMEKIFEIYRKIIYLENPDRVIKIHEGDYNPLSECWGNSDFHCYTYWYISNNIIGGLFNKGYLPGNRTNWMTGCGEYGVDGLDRYELMKKYCPKEWLPNKATDPWTPKQIPMSQAWTSGSNFYPEQENIKDWIKYSREYQRIAIKDYVDNLRRRTDVVQSRAVHLLIDAWPCGWTKTLIDVDRIPKPAFYAFKSACTPFKVSIRSDRRCIYNDEKIKFDIFALNDLSNYQKGQIIVSVYENNKLVKSFKKNIIAQPVNQNYVGTISYKITKDFAGDVEIRAKMVNEKNESTYDNLLIKSVNRTKVSNDSPKFLGKNLYNLKKLFGTNINNKVIFCDGEYYKTHKNQLEKKVFNGTRVVLFTDICLDVLEDRIGFWKHPIAGQVLASNWLQIEESSPFVRNIGKFGFKDFYNSTIDSLDSTCWYKFYWDKADPILFFQHDRGNPKYQFHKEKKFAVAIKKYGKGEIIVSTLSNINGFVNYNPVFDQFLINLYSVNKGEEINNE